MNLQFDKYKILVTFVGITDPIISDRDGPLLHICRVHKPEKIYLILVGSKMKKRHNVFWGTTNDR